MSEQTSTAADKGEGDKSTQSQDVDPKASEKNDSDQGNSKSLFTGDEVAEIIKDRIAREHKA